MMVSALLIYVLILNNLSWASESSSSLPLAKEHIPRTAPIDYATLAKIATDDIIKALAQIKHEPAQIKMLEESLILIQEQEKIYRTLKRLQTDANKLKERLKDAVRAMKEMGMREAKGTEKSVSIDLKSPEARAFFLANASYIKEGVKIWLGENIDKETIQNGLRSGDPEIKNLSTVALEHQEVDNFMKTETQLEEEIEDLLERLDKFQYKFNFSLLFHAIKTIAHYTKKEITKKLKENIETAVTKDNYEEEYSTVARIYKQAGKVYLKARPYFEVLYTEVRKQLATRAANKAKNYPKSLAAYAEELSKKEQIQAASPPATKNEIVEPTQYKQAEKSADIKEELSESSSSNDTSSSSSSPTKTRKYAPRVTMWYQDPNKAIIEQGYAGLEAPVQRKIIAFHSLPFALNKYLDQYGIITDWDTNTKNISISGEITFDGAAEPIIGVFQEGFNTKTGVTYHRCFTERPLDEQIRDRAEKSFWESNFPPLGASIENTNSSDTIIAQDHSFVASDNEYVATIRDPKNNATVIVYKK